MGQPKHDDHKPMKEPHREDRTVLPVCAKKHGYEITHRVDAGRTRRQRDAPRGPALRAKVTEDLDHGVIEGVWRWGETLHSPSISSCIISSGPTKRVT